MYDEARVNLQTRATTIEAYGREFKFPGHGHPDHYSGKQQALRDARQYGAQLLDGLEQKVGRKLSVRECLSARLDPAPDTRSVGDQVRASVVIDSRQDTEPTNPFEARIAELERDRPATDWERGQRQRRLEMFRAKSREYDSDRKDALALEARNESRAVKYVKERASQAWTLGLLDKNTTAAELRVLQTLRDMAHDNFSDPEECKKLLDAADETRWARLDAIAAQQKEAVLLIESEHVEARRVAEQARKELEVSENE